MGACCWLGVKLGERGVGKTPTALSHWVPVCGVAPQRHQYRPFPGVEHAEIRSAQALCHIRAE